MRGFVSVVSAGLAFLNQGVVGSPENVADQLLALAFLNKGVVGSPDDNLTLLTQCAGFSEDTVQARHFMNYTCRSDRQVSYNTVDLSFLPPVPRSGPSEARGTTCTTCQPTA